MTILLVIKKCVGRESCLLDLLEGDGVLGGGGAAVFKLGGNISNAALFVGVEAKLDADGAVGGIDRGVAAVEAEAAVLTDADPKGAGFAEDQLLERWGVGGVAKDGKERAGAAFFHDDRGEHDVESSPGERGFGDEGEDLGGEVVESGFDDGDGVGFSGFGLYGFRGGCLADA